MIEILGSKMYPSKAQLTKLRDKDLLKGFDTVFYVRENVTPEGAQVLELCAPEADWARIAGIVGCEDSVRRPILKAQDFTPEWAEAELARR
jgi:hypothetical protein